MDVRAVARLVREGLGRERGDQAVPEGHAARRLPQGDLVVGGAQGLREAHRQLLLAGPQLRVVLLGMHALGGEGLHDVGHDGRGAVHPDGREAVALVEGDVGRARRGGPG